MKLDDFKQAMRELYVRPHCQSHSNAQGRAMGRLNNREIYDRMNKLVPGLNI